MVSNVLYLPQANRKCRNCDCTKAVCGRIGTHDPHYALIPTIQCGTCGDLVEAKQPPINVSAKTGHVSCCDDCGTEDDLALATITLPENLGTGHIFLCPDCIARYDDAESVLAACNGA